MLLRLSLSFSVLLCHLVLGIPLSSDSYVPTKPTQWTDLIYNHPVKDPPFNTYVEYKYNSEPKNAPIDNSGAMSDMNNELQPALSNANLDTSVENKVDFSQQTDLHSVNPGSLPQANVIDENATPNQNGFDSVVQVQSSNSQPEELTDNNAGLLNVENLKQVNNSGQEFENSPVVAEKKPADLKQEELNTLYTQTIVSVQQTTLYYYEVAQPSSTNQPSPPTLTPTVPSNNFPIEENNINGVSAVNNAPEPPTIHTSGLDLNKEPSQVDQPVYPFEPKSDPIHSQPALEQHLSDQPVNFEQIQNIASTTAPEPKETQVEQPSSADNGFVAPFIPPAEYTENQEVAVASPQQVERVIIPNSNLAVPRDPNVDGMKEVQQTEALVLPTTTEPTPNVPAPSVPIQSMSMPVKPVVPTPFITSSNDLPVPAGPQSKEIQEVLVPTFMAELDPVQSSSPVANIPEQLQTTSPLLTTTFAPTFEIPSIQAQPTKESEPISTEDSSLLKERLEKVESLLREYNDKQNVGSSAADVVPDIDTDAQHDTKSISENIAQPLDNNLAEKQIKETNDNLSNKVFKLVVEEQSEATSTTSIKPQPTQLFHGAFDPSSKIKLPNGSWVPSCKNVSKGFYCLKPDGEDPTMIECSGENVGFHFSCGNNMMCYSIGPYDVDCQTPNV